MDTWLEPERMAMSTEIELPPDADRIIEVFRDTGYTFETAISDLVDNSIEAGADFIDIRLATDSASSIFVSIADNGIGMSQDDLRRAMQYGSPRDAERILGKFGIGLKTASTSFARELTVTSRTDTLNVCTARWDLDIIADRNKWILIEEDPTLLDNELLDECSPRHSGTLVRWSKVDRLLTERQNESSENSMKRALENKASNLISHLGLVFHRFMQGKTPFPMLSIRVNNKMVEPWDPMMTGNNKVDILFDGDLNQTWGDGTVRTFSALGITIPHKSELDADERTLAHIGNDNQGVYVYRENRLIAEPTWFKKKKKEPHSSLARVALNFTRDCDDLFGVDIKKSRIEMMPSTLEYLHQQIMLPVINAAESRYRGKGSHERANGSINTHGRSNRTLEVEGVHLTDFSAESVDDENATITNSRGRTTVRLATPQGDQNNWVYAKQSIDDGMLWIPEFKDGHAVAALNAGHEFYVRVYAPNQNASVTQAFDYLVWAISNAEIGLSRDTDKELMVELRYAVSRALRRLANELPEPKEE